jgi:hypothetical protein
MASALPASLERAAPARRMIAARQQWPNTQVRVLGKNPLNVNRGLPDA